LVLFLSPTNQQGAHGKISPDKALFFRKGNRLTNILLISLFPKKSLPQDETGWELLNNIIKFIRGICYH
jgi:hypothetical protein